MYKAMVNTKLATPLLLRRMFVGDLSTHPGYTRAKFSIWTGPSDDTPSDTKQRFRPVSHRKDNTNSGRRSFSYIALSVHASTYEYSCQPPELED
jgi:hypothetical protein